MLLDFIYGHSTWLIGSLMVLAAAGYGCLGVLVIGWLVPVETRRRHNELIGYIVSVAGVNYAVLLGFVAVSVWQSFDHASDLATTEANLLSDVYRDAVGLPPPERGAIRNQLRIYLDRVVKEEWPIMATGKSSPAGWEALVRIPNIIKRFEPQSETEKIFTAELLHQLNQLYDARRGRSAAAEGGVQAVIWVILLLCAAMIIGFTFLFAMDSRKMHMLLTGLLASGTALVLLLIVSMDWPFRGEVQVGPDMFLRVADNMRIVDAIPPE